jgi:hypothetical protein
MTHVSQDGEDDTSAKDGGEGVDPGDPGAIPDKVSVVLVVRSQGNHPAHGAAEGIEDLGAGIDPDLCHGNKGEKGGENRREGISADFEFFRLFCF